MIVVDTNVLAYLYLPGEYTAHAEGLMRRDSQWAAPTLWRSGFRNILAGYIKRKTLTLDQALGLQNDAETLLTGSEFEVESPAILELVGSSDGSAYDCEFKALAIKQNTRLVTMDKKLLKSFPEQAVALNANSSRQHKSTSPDQRHLGCHDRHVQHVGRQGQRGHLHHRISNFTGVHHRLNGNFAVNLRNTLAILADSSVKALPMSI